MAVRVGAPQSRNRLPVSYGLTCLSRDALHASVYKDFFMGCFSLRGANGIDYTARRGTSFRSVHAAMAAARDGDHIILRKGIHNGLG